MNDWTILQHSLDRSTMIDRYAESLKRSSLGTRSPRQRWIQHANSAGAILGAALLLITSPLTSNAKHSVGPFFMHVGSCTTDVVLKGPCLGNGFQFEVAPGDTIDGGYHTCQTCGHSDPTCEGGGTYEIFTTDDELIVSFEETQQGVQPTHWLTFNGCGPKAIDDEDDMAEEDLDDCGMPVWRVSEPYISLWLHDEPLGYQPSIGNRLSFRLSYKQREYAAGTLADFFNVGYKWNCSWLSYVTKAWNTSNLVHFPSGGQRIFSGETDYLTQTTLSGDSTNGFTLNYPDGSEVSYGFIVTNHLGALIGAFMTEQRNPQGQNLTFNYADYDPEGPVVRLLEVIDGDGKTNTISYVTNNAWSTNLISEVTDAYGRTAKLLYDDDGFLTNVTDVAGLASSFLYDSSTFWITNVTTPYGTNSFAITDTPSGETAPNGRAIEITQPDGSKQLYAYADDVPGQTNAYPTAEVPDTGSISETQDNTELDDRNSFYWGTLQYDALSTNSIADFTAADFRKGRMRHWLKFSSTSVGETLSLQRDPSPDTAGSIEGQKTWYDYAGKTNDAYQGTQFLPLLVAQVLPDGDTRFSRTARNDLGAVTNLISTYSLPGGTVALRTNTFEYAANDIDLIEHIGPDGELQVGYSYTNHLILRYTNALEEVTVYTYDADGRPTSVASPAGLTTTNLYHTSGDYEGWLEETIDVEIERTNTFTYADGLVHTHTDERGLTITNTWDALQRLRRVDYPDNTFVTNTYKWLDLVKVVDRMGYTDLFGYDELRRMTDVTNALGAVTHYEYCTCGSLESVTDGLSNPTTFYRDNLGRATNIVYPGGISVNQDYNLLGQLVSTTDAWGSATNYYSNQGLQVAVSNAFGQVSRVIHDIEDRVTNSVDANGVTVSTTHDDLGRALTRTYPDDGVESFGYDESGLIAYTNQLAKVWTYAYDVAGRMSSEVAVGMSTNKFGYNSAGDLTSLIDARHKNTGWEYDIYGSVKLKRDDTDSSILTYGYDANSRLTNRWSDEKGNTAYSYDAAGNLTGVNYPVSTDITLSYDALNRLTNMVDAVGTTVYSYTALGQLQSEDGPWASDTVSYTYDNRLRDGLSLEAPNASDWTQSYGYDSARRLTSVTSSAGAFTYTLGGSSTTSPLIKKLALPGGAYITNAYDTVARLLFTDLKNSSHGVLNSHDYGYNQGNQRTQQVFTADNYVNYTYDDIGQLKTATGKESGGTTRLQEKLGYAYDAAGNLNYRTNNALLQTFTVNNINELSSVGRSGTLTVAGTTTSEATSVTVSGNGLSSGAATLYDDFSWARAGAAPADGDNTYTAIAQDSYGRKDTNSSTAYLPTTASYTYDDNGNLTYDGQRVFTYDDENQLITALVSNEWKSVFEYDGKMRRRIRRECAWSGSTWVTNETVLYVYDGNLVIQERDGNNLPKVTYTRGTDLSGSLQGAGGIGGLLARSSNSQLVSPSAHALYHADGNGNITALVSTNELLLGRYHYDPYGNLASLNGAAAEANLYRFSSKEWHANSGLAYYLYRFYDPNLQRWLNRDPIEELGGVNLYKYLQNEPLDLVDPYGLFGLGDDLLSLIFKRDQTIDAIKELESQKPLCKNRQKELRSLYRQLDNILTRINQLKNGGFVNPRVLARGGAVVAAGAIGAFTGYYTRNEVNAGFQSLGGIFFDAVYGNPFGTSSNTAP